MTDELSGQATDEIDVGDAGPRLVVEDLQREDFVKFAGLYRRLQSDALLRPGR